ncbi:leucine-rich repeat-containing protein 74A isoform X3 [Patella vulgata]|uniref:leucine-rich repeat-containing protein 74A isoform X3 n=1 Tax=Patella vulgata TaxID=6465 RepID=UPI0024A81DC9|nr:leucine-rich repeat-containing protein 74A isoform X3 [Patella vulgata]
MTQLCTKQSSLRPQTASQLKNDDISLQLDTLMIRPLSANPISAGQNGTFLTEEGGNNYSVIERLRIDPVLDQFSFSVRSAKKKKLNIKTTKEAWLKKTKPEDEKIHPFVDQSLNGLDNSDEYDTDIEEDFPKPENKYRADPTGIYRYQEKCIKSGILPISYLRRHIGRRNVRMRHHYLGGEASKAIAEALRVNTVTESLDLSDNYLKCCGARFIADMMLDNMFILHMNLSNNFIRTRGVEALSVMLQNNTTLKTLSLSGNQLCDRDAGLLVEGIKNNDTLQSLDLSNNNIGELGGIYLGNGLAINESLVDIDLSWNCITRKGAVGVAQALKRC